MDTDGFTTCLWFDGQAEEAAQFYVSVFDGSKLGEVVRNTGATPAARTAPCSPWSSRPTGRSSSP